MVCFAPMHPAEGHYAHATVEKCWLCAPGEPCHVHDPEVRRRLDRNDDEPVVLAWTREGVR